MALTSWYSWSFALMRGLRRGAGAKENYSLPLSDAQLGIWFAQSIDPSSPAYNLAEYLEIDGSIDAALLETALRQVVNEIEPLRVRFVSDVAGPRQIIGPAPDLSMSFIDVSGATDPQAAAEQWMNADLAKPIDLTNGQLFAYALLKVAPDRFFWYSRYHHIVMDGYCLALIARRMADVYTALAAGLTADAPPFSSLPPLLEDDARYRASKTFEQDRQYWIASLADLPEPASLGDGSWSKSSGFIRHTGLLSFSTIEHLHSIAHRAGGSLAQFITAVSAIFVYRLTGVQDVVLDVPLTGRMTPDARRMPCLMSNVLPVRLAVRPSMTVSELVGETTRRMRQAIRHQRYNIANLRRDIGRSGDRRAFGPTVNVMSFDYDLRFNGRRATPHKLSTGPADDMYIVVYDRSRSRGTRLDFEGNPALYSHDRLAALQQRLLRLLAAIADPVQTIGTLDILAPDERRTILLDWNDTAHAVPSATLPEVFAAQ